MFSQQGKQSPFGDFDSNSTANITLTDCETTATSLTYGAGIGGGLKNNRCTSNISVDGGKLNAIGAGGGSGIGTGPVNTVSQANVTIDGDAVVVATGSGATDEQLAEGDNPIGTDAGAGIGGTGDQYVGNITIRSGDITAVGGSVEGCCAAGIGGSSNAKAGTVTISGGTVHATGGYCDQCGAAGIGGGANSNAGTVTISGGEVTALGSHGEKMGGAGIGGGPRGDGGTVIIEGGTVNAIGSERGAGIGGGFNGNGGDVACCGTSYIPVEWMLEQLPQVTRAFLCYDNDRAGQEAVQRATEQLNARGVEPVRDAPTLKDWKEGSEIIVDNCQVNIFGGFAPASQTAEEMSKALGTRTVLSGSISRGKDNPSQSLQMMERPLMTPDELKTMPKGAFIVMKTGVHPMQVRLRLFLDWGIRFGAPYEVPEKAQRSVAYASQEELEEAIFFSVASTAGLAKNQPVQPSAPQGRMRT